MNSRKRTCPPRNEPCCNHPFTLLLASAWLSWGWVSKSLLLSFKCGFLDITASSRMIFENLTCLFSLLHPVNSPLISSLSQPLSAGKPGASDSQPPSRLDVADSILYTGLRLYAFLRIGIWARDWVRPRLKPSVKSLFGVWPGVECISFCHTNSSRLSMPAASPFPRVAKDAFPFCTSSLLPSVCQLAFQEFKGKVTARPPFSSPRGISHFSFGGKNFIFPSSVGIQIVGYALIFMKTFLFAPQF